MPRTLLVASMKNECPFIMEWVAYHRVIGFESLIVASNDCEDGTDLLLDALAREGVISHRLNPIRAGEDPQWTFLSELSDHPTFKRADWVMALDADEFVRIDIGAGRIDDLIAAKPDADAFVLLWKTFGDGGLTRWDGGLVLERFTRCEDRTDAWNRCQKTIFRNSPKFSGMDAHYPIVAESTAIEDLAVYNARIERYDPKFFLGEVTKMSGLQTDQSRWTWDNARVNHYPYKTPDLFALKRHRGDNVPGRGDDKYREDSAYGWLRSKNDAEDDSAHFWLPELVAELELLRGSRRIREAEEAALRRYAALRRKVLGPSRGAKGAASAQARAELTGP